ncbi:MAG TPA: ATP-binding protein [Desulfomonilia bacterium]
MTLSKHNSDACQSRFIISIFTILSVFLFIITPSANADDRVVRVGVYENAPKVFTSDTGKPEGIFIDIIEYIAKIEGWKLQYIPGTWAEGLERLSRGEIDLMPDVAYTAEREKRFSFHKVPVLFSWSQVYAPKDSKIKAILDLNGKRIAILEGSVQKDTFDMLTHNFGLNITLISVPDYKTMFEKVARHEIDAGITNRFYGLMHAKKYGLEDTAIIFDPSTLFFAAPGNAQRQLLDAIDKNLLDMKSDPNSIYYASLKRWTSEEVHLKLPAWLKLLGLITGIMLIMSLIGTFILKHQVNVRTRELWQINNEMEQRIKERTAELAVAMEKAQEADRIKSAFLATMSHELRTPLNSIIGFTGIMLQGLAGPLNEEQRKQMTMVQTSSRHLLSLINDVLDISKIEAGQLDLSMTSFDLKQSIEKIVKLVSPLAEQKGLSLHVDISENVGTIISDQRRLEQVILNLLNNAIKFTEKGRVGISCGFDHDHCLLTVTDTGIGMRAEELADIFQPFHQIDTGLTRKHEGTGLGLSICKKLLDMMGGSIDVTSELGKGSTFTIRIPIKTGGLT